MMSPCECYLENSLPRISARNGQLVDLNVDFYNNGKLDDPFWIKKVEIYKCNTSPHNLQSIITVIEPDNPYYPSPICQEKMATNDGDCGTEDIQEIYIPGKYHLPFLVPSDFKSPEVYIDVWYYYPKNPCDPDSFPADCPPVNDLTDEDITNCDITDPDLEHLLKSCCHRFWVYPDSWFCSDGIQTVEFSYEPLSVRFNYPEKRNLEIGLIPLPIYNHNRKLVESLIPYIKPYITIGTQHCEYIVSDVLVELGFRQGHNCQNPWMIKYLLDTNKFLKGSYWYQIKLELPDGTTRVSNKFWIEIR